MLKKHLHRSTSGAMPNYPFVHDWIYGSRTFDETLFDLVWASIFDALLAMSPPEGAAVDNLQEQYFYQVWSPGAKAWRWDAAWRVGPDRVQLGSASGSSAQEAWQLNSLQNAIEAKYQSPLALARDLGKFTRSRLVQLTNEVPVIRDWPGIGASLDLFCLRGDAALRRECRSSAYALVESQRIVRHQDGANEWFLVPRTLWRYDAAAGARDHDTTKKKKGQPQKTVPKDLAPLPRDALTNISKYLTAATHQEKLQHLANLGVVTLRPGPARITNWLLTAQLFTEWCTVCIGPHAESLWAVEGGADAEDMDARHAAVQCFYCAETAVHGPCEHGYAGHVLAGGISSRSCVDDESKPTAPQLRHAMEIGRAHV